MKEEKKPVLTNKKSFAVFMGRTIGNCIVLCLSTCVMAVLATITYNIVRWILGIGGIV